MKKVRMRIFNVLLVLMISMLVVACGGKDRDGVATGEESSVGTETLAVGEFDTSATIEKTVLWDKDNVKITATELEYTESAVNVHITIENGNNEEIRVGTGAFKADCNSVNGYMLLNEVWEWWIPAGQTVTDLFRINNDKNSIDGNLRKYGITAVSDMELGFQIRKESETIYTGPCVIKTSIANSHDYSEDSYQDVINSTAMQSESGYVVKYFSKDVKYDKDGVRLLSQTMIVNQMGERELLLEVENTTSKQLYAVVEDVSINEKTSRSGEWVSQIINPGKKCVVQVNLSEMASEEMSTVYDVNKKNNINFVLAQYEMESNPYSKYSENTLLHRGSVEMVISETDMAGK